MNDDRILEVGIGQNGISSGIEFGQLVLLFLGVLFLGLFLAGSLGITLLACGEFGEGLCTLASNLFVILADLDLG